MKKKLVRPEKAVKSLRSRVLRAEGFQKGYRGTDLDLYAQGLPVPKRKVQAE